MVFSITGVAASSSSRGKIVAFPLSSILLSDSASDAVARS